MSFTWGRHQFSLWCQNEPKDWFFAESWKFIVYWPKSHIWKTFGFFLSFTKKCSFREGHSQGFPPIFTYSGGPKSTILGETLDIFAMIFLLLTDLKLFQNFLGGTTEIFPILMGGETKNFPFWWLFLVLSPKIKWKCNFFTFL